MSLADAFIGGAVSGAARAIPAPISLLVQGQRYEGWKSARITRSIEAIAGSFELSVSERWANRNTNWPIHEGNQCKILAYDKPVITGYVDSIKSGFSTTDAGISVAGRDAAAQLVDCSAIIGGWQLSNIALDALAKKLCAPFGIVVKLAPDLIGKVPIVRQLAFGVGETGFDVLDSACRQVGVLAINDGNGEITLCHPGEDHAVTPLVQGQNLLSAEATFSVASRFAKYRVMGQGGGYEEIGGYSTAHVVAEATDPNVTNQNRVLIVHAEDALDQSAAKKRAQWEASIRAARSASVAVSVQGWQQENGDLWEPNLTVRVEIPRCRVMGEMVISEVTYIFEDGEGTRVNMQLKRPDAFTPAPVVTKDGTYRELKGGV
ncbi:MAG: hypothetical protein QM723_40645 [Myxococcaceae bacterium]